MRATTALFAVLCFAALAADDMAVAPRQAASFKPQAIGYGAEAITIPQMLSYQGKLTDTLGVPVPDGSYPMMFLLYTTPSGGSSFWSENQSVTTEDGLFSVLLGSVTPIGSIPDGGAVYLAMTVSGGPEMTPRVRVVSSAFAYLSGRAASADLLQGTDTTALWNAKALQGKDTAGFVRTNQASSVTGAMLVDGTVLTADVGDTAVTMAKIAQAGATTGQVVKWTGSAWAPGQDNTGGGSGVTSVYQDTGIICVPNPITSSGNVKLELSFSDGRYVNEAQANSVTEAMISDANVTSADIRDTTITTAKLKDDAVTSAKILDGSVAAADIRDTTVNTADIKDAAVTAPKLNQMGALSGQVMKWTGSAWQPRNDSTGAGDSAWVRGTPDSVLYTIRRLGVARGGSDNMLYGNFRQSHVNLGVSCTTGVSGQNYSNLTIGGGIGNVVGAAYSTVAGGLANRALGIGAAVAGGAGNVAGDAATDTAATVAGGYGNAATGVFATVSGGWYDTASNYYATVGGGVQNTASGPNSTVSGGAANAASANQATVGGGWDNSASATGAAVAGGTGNNALGIRAFVGGGYQNSAGDAAADTAATVAGGWDNAATGMFATVGGGRFDSASNYHATVGGGRLNVASGQNSTVSGGTQNRASSTSATVGGGQDNRASGSSATVSGGSNNTATEYVAFVGGGAINDATGQYSAIGGGNSNLASGNGSTVGGGSSNDATATHATVGGGTANTASGSYATVPGGSDNAARGSYSLAAGRYARANHGGSFVWSDSCAIADSVYTGGANQWRVRARGGVWFYSNLAKSTGAYLAPGSNSWESACDSATKEDFRPVDRRELLDKVAALRVRDYKMKDQNDGTRHIGPVAQDFHNAFGYGGTETGINMADADGVLLAAVQALYEQNQMLSGRIDVQQVEIEALEAELKRR